MHGLDQEGLSRYIGKSRALVAAYEAGTRAVQPDDLAKLLSAFPDAPPYPGAGDIKVTASLAREGIEYRIKFAGIVPAGSEWGDPLNSDEYIPIDYKFTGAKRFAAVVAGHSCHPYLQQGDTVIFEADPAPKDHSIVLAQRSSDAACTVKELGREGLDSKLLPLNPDYDPPSDEDGWSATATLIGVIFTFEGADMEVFVHTGVRRKHLEHRRSM